MTLQESPVKIAPVPYQPQLRPPARRPMAIPKYIISLLLIGYSILVIYPLFWLFYSSLKTDRDIFLTPFSLPTSLHFENFTNAWTLGHFGAYFGNSVVLTFSTVIITTFLAAMTAYAVSRFQFGFSKPIYFFFLAGLMIPIQLAIVPLFFELRNMHMLDSRTGLFFVYLAFGFPFSVFVLTGFFKSL